MPILRLETPEATFINNMRGDQHFIIDCACKGTDGQYHGAHYRNSQPEEISVIEDYSPRYGSKSDHTFYMSEFQFLEILELHKEEDKEPPIVVVCNDCKREFPFTSESYFQLKEAMMRAYSTQDIKAELRREEGKGLTVVPIQEKKIPSSTAAPKALKTTG